MENAAGPLRSHAGLVKTRFRLPKRKSTIAIDEGRIARHIKPQIGGIQADAVTRATVQLMADAIAQGKTAGIFKTGQRGKAVVTGGPGTARRVVELFGGIWSWAEKRGHVSSRNPVRGVETKRGEAKDRVLSTAELSALGEALRQNEAMHENAVAVIRLIALTGLRSEEASGLRWRELDVEASCLRMSFTKTGRSTRPIGKSTVCLLRSLKRAHPEFVFPNARGDRSADLKKAVTRLFKLAGLADARSHDLRRTFASVAADQGYSDATIGELLGHARRGVTAKHYIRRPDAALIAAADQVSDFIGNALGLSDSADNRKQAPHQQS